jgi:hypothetical protein
MEIEYGETASQRDFFKSFSKQISMPTRQMNLTVYSLSKYE